MWSVEALSASALLQQEVGLETDMQSMFQETLGRVLSAWMGVDGCGQSEGSVSQAAVNQWMQQRILQGTTRGNNEPSNDASNSSHGILLWSKIMEAVMRSCWNPKSKALFSVAKSKHSRMVLTAVSCLSVDAFLGVAQSGAVSR